MTVQPPPLVKKKAIAKPSASNPTTAETKYCWRVKMDLNKKKYPAIKASTKDTSSIGDDQPSTSFNSTVPAKANLLQMLLHHRVSSELVIRRFVELKCFHMNCQSQALASQNILQG